jgi:hypothetical protein
MAASRRERQMKKILVCAAAGLLFVAAQTVYADETWKGTISDSACASKHSADKHGGNAQKHEDCVARCVERGSEYVFLTGEKVYKIANQNFADLKANAGKEVSLTGELKGESITVSKIEAPKK